MTDNVLAGCYVSVCVLPSALLDFSLCNVQANATSAGLPSFFFVLFLLSGIESVSPYCGGLLSGLLWLRCLAWVPQGGALPYWLG